MKRWAVPLWIIVIGIPFIFYLIKNATCGWDCGFYIYHLSQTDYSGIYSITEPLYFWIFMPLVDLGLDPILVMKISMTMMILASSFGVYILSNRLGLSRGYSILSMVIFAFSLSTIRLWSDTLRNFLAFSLLPYFIYFYIGKSRRWISYAIVMLMGLSHRMVLMVFPIMAIHNIIERNWKRLFLELGAVLIPLIVMASFVSNSDGHNAIFRAMLHFIGEFGIFTNLLENFKIMLFFNTIIVIFACLGIVTVSKEKSFRFIAIMFITFFAFSLPFNHLFGGRLILMMSLPGAILTGIFIQNIMKRSGSLTKARKLVLSVSVIGLLFGAVFPGIYNLSSSVGSISYEEIEFIDSIEAPHNSTIICPSRLFYFCKYRLPQYHIMDVEYYSYLGLANSTKLTADVYRGINIIGNLYYIDGDHFKPNSTNPLTIKYSEMNS